VAYFLDHPACGEFTFIMYELCLVSIAVKFHETFGPEIFREISREIFH